MKARTFLWYLHRMSFYPYMIEELSRKFRDKSIVGSKHEANDWCQKQAVTKEQVYGWLECEEALIPNDLESQMRSLATEIPVQMGSEGDLSMIYSIVNGRSYSKCIESGVSMGFSTSAILRAQKDFGSGDTVEALPTTLVSVDMPYPNRNNEEWVGHCVPETLRDNWVLVRRPDRNGLNKALKIINDPEFYHYDSDKTFWGRIFAFSKIFEKLRPGGIFMMDDIDDNFGFKHIVENHDVEFKVYKFKSKFVGIIVKRI